MKKEIIKFISEANKEINEKLESLGAKKQTVERYFEGARILTCPKCETYNLCEVESFEKTLEYLQEKKVNLEKYGNDFEIFYCNRCEDYAIRYKGKK